MVQTREFAEFLGRLGFVAQLLTWMKAHLSPLYSWSAATAAGTVANFPKLSFFRCSTLLKGAFGGFVLGVCTSATIFPYRSISHRCEVHRRYGGHSMLVGNVEVGKGVGSLWRFSLLMRRTFSNLERVLNGHPHQPSYWRRWLHCFFSGGWIHPPVGR